MEFVLSHNTLSWTDLGASKTSHPPRKGYDSHDTMSLIKYSQKNSIALIALNDPKRLNAMSVEMGREFTQILSHIKKDKTIRVVIITGSGRAFSSGGNLDMLEKKMQNSRLKNERLLKKFYKIFLAVRNIPQPVIAAVNGPAVGAGFCLSMACDLRYASEQARFSANFARIGLAPGMGSTSLVSRLVGPVFAAEILFTAKTFDATEAQKYGLINDVFSSNVLLNEVEKIADRIASNAPLAIRFIKKGIQLAQNKTLEDMFNFESKSQAICFQTRDIREGITAIREKRSPVFIGK